jgi:hypothetical protein
LLAPKLKDEPPALPPNPPVFPVFAVVPNPPVELPKPVFCCGVELPNKPPPVFVLELKGFDAGLLPKRELEVLVLPPKPVGRRVSSSISLMLERENVAFVEGGKGFLERKAIKSDFGAEARFQVE